jgi:hypothetical protein
LVQPFVGQHRKKNRTAEAVRFLKDDGMEGNSNAEKLLVRRKTGGALNEGLIIAHEYFFSEDMPIRARVNR